MNTNTLLEEEIQMCDNMIKTETQTGSNEMVKCNWYDIMAIVVKNGDLTVLKRLLEEEIQIYSDMIKTGAQTGSIEMIKCAREHGSDWYDTMGIVVKNGNLAVIKYILEEGCPCNERSIMLEFIRNGHLEIVKYLHEIGFLWDEGCCHVASVYGHLEILKYLHENGCPWDGKSSSSAFINGHLEILKYLYKNGCPWDESHYLTALKYEIRMKVST